jgi:hypothetical protein
MSWAAAAAVGGAVIGAVATNNAADQSADAIGDAADATAATNRYMYDTTRADQAPYRQVGTGALNRLAAMYGLPQYQDPSAATTYSAGSDVALVENRGGVPVENARLYATDPLYKKAWDEAWARHTQAFGRGFDDHSDFSAIEYDLRRTMEADPSFRTRSASPIQGRTGDTINGATGQVENDWSSFFDSPDYQFALQEGNRSVNQGLAARGLANSGAAMKELTRYGQGMASQQLGNYTNRLAALAGIGQTATQATSDAGTRAAGNISAAQMAAGDARASAYTTRGSAINNVINQGTGAFMLSQLQPQPYSGYTPSGAYTSGTGYARVGG